METCLVDAHWYTLKEQIIAPHIIDREHLDLVHFPHWNVPLLLRTPFIVTIHDLILLEEPRSAKVTTRHPLVFFLKRLAYRNVLRSSLKRSRAIIAVSQYTKSSILTHFPWVPAEKIHVVYEGLTNLHQTPPCLPLSRGGELEVPPPSQGGARGGRVRPYFLYVGNAYPHKNLESLLHAFSFFHKLHPDVRLVLAGRNDIFYERLKKELAQIDVAPEAVEFTLNPSDADLANLYRGATLYLFPSRSEGFGLPPLEAMSFGVPVAAARRTSLPEILGDAALWFNPDDIQEMVSVMETALVNNPLRDSLVNKGFEQIKRYSWTTMTREILKIYESCA
ncbi:MAG: Glycosyl transferase family protein [Candidatus Uhrbacteria bacterium GW2011_GWA2_52_8d]|uniref:Glycosyl transferase family protein n=1 Tax=Candidatus Uhrbacteria bacterium GW2011_GWA2_52_8d TaxID=1618979 RepID=A0A0G1XR56_9BACT|nr:MAG: Glycosyl transferase family protein [Candidatus Uhrbacteria bacterium GW2011_GWA2_52_8d]